MPLSGFSNVNTPSDLLLDSGVLYVGAAVQGPSRGGWKIDTNKEVRDVEFDGKRSPILGMQRTSKFAPVFSGTLIQLRPADALFMEPGATTTVTGVTTPTGVITPKKAGTTYVAGDYISNARIIFERSNNLGYWQTRFPSALVRKWAGKGTDNSEAEFDVEIMAVLNAGASGATVADAPYLLEYLSTP